MTIKKLILVLGVLLLISCGGGNGGSSSSASGHTALCNDGTYSDSKNCSGTCSSHGGVKEWYVNCGTSASKLASAILINNTPANNAGSWAGTWINKKDNLSGTIRVNITEETLIAGTFFNKDNTLNSKFHSYVDDNGTVRLFLDIQQSPFESPIEYIGDISLNNINDKLTGSINIQESETEEIREVELYRE